MNIEPGVFLIVSGVILAVILQGLRNVPANPPTVAVVTTLGERTGKVKNEGLRFFFLYPWIRGFVPVECAAKSQDLSPEDVRTPDMAELEIGVATTWYPDINNAINYLNSGGEKGVKDIIDDLIGEAVRERAANPSKEPKTWEEAVKSKALFVAEIVATMQGEDPDQMNPDELKKLALELRRGNGSIKIDRLGITVSRLNLTSIKVKGELAADAEKVARETKQKEAEKIEIQNVIDRVNQLKGAGAAGTDTGISTQDAIEITQTERGKVQKHIHEIKLNTDTANALSTVFSAFLKK